MSSLPDSTLRWGIIATGNIAASMAAALHRVPEAEIVAVASRSMEAAESFGSSWDIPRRYDSYAAMVGDDDVDVVYVATPHAYHHENVVAALRAGKHVLCEKPLTLNAAQAAECAALARAQGLFLMEAVWMRFFPAITRLVAVVGDGAVGEVELLVADFCLDVPFDPTHRLYNLDLGGGALLDLGVYPLSFATMLLGAPQTVEGRARVGATGVDETNSVTLTFASGAIAQLASSCRSYKPHTAHIIGREGRIEVPDFFHPGGFVIHRHGGREEVRVPAWGNGYVHEVEEVHRCIRAGLTESPVLPLAETVATMELMDELRRDWGVVYPGEAGLPGD
ncbi:MAG: Gfo/Idh/MocA family oxidoreductase [Acidimicrobiia bacterium]|nr:Gfo/Idh/MocA family oxidoreductase [Acidimicrobiia bacterium]